MYLSSRYLVVGIAVLFQVACEGDDSLPTTLNEDETYGWHAFLEHAEREPWEDGQYIVDGDIPLSNEDQLFEYYLRYVRQERAARQLEARIATSARGLKINQVGGQDDVQPENRRFRLTYCISRWFGTRYRRVVAAMYEAGRSWADKTGVEFVHLKEQDRYCTASNQAVHFDVRPVSNAIYNARAFFPSAGRARRNILVNNTAFGPQPFGVTFEGIMKHELGHVLGFRHEHIQLNRTCTGEPNRQARSLTIYDPQSVMHYPRCRSPQAGGYSQSELDYLGAKSLYGNGAAEIANVVAGMEFL